MDDAQKKRLAELRELFLDELDADIYTHYADDEDVRPLEVDERTGLEPLIVSSGKWSNPCATCGQIKYVCDERRRQLVLKLHQSQGLTYQEIIGARAALHMIQRNSPTLHGLSESQLPLKDIKDRIAEFLEQMETAPVSAGDERAKMVPYLKFLDRAIQPKDPHPFQGVLWKISSEVRKKLSMSSEEFLDLVDELDRDDFLDGRGDFSSLFNIVQDFPNECERCSECGGHVNTLPLDHGWIPKYKRDPESGEYICSACLRKEPERALEMCLNKNTTCDNFVDPEELGFVQLLSDRPNGTWAMSFYGHKDSPEGQIEALNDHGYDVLIKVFNSQFMGEWDLYVRPQGGWPEGADPEDLRGELEEFVHECGRCQMKKSPRQALEEGLRASDAQKKALEEEHGGPVSTYTTINQDGTASTRVIKSTEDL